MSPFLPAQTDPMQPAWLLAISALSALIGAVGQWGYRIWGDYRKSKTDAAERQRQEKKEDEDNAITRIEALNDRLDRERKEGLERERLKDQRIDRLQEQVSRERILSARMLVWIRHQDDVLKSNNIRTRTWDDVMRETADIVGTGERSAPETTVE